MSASQQYYPGYYPTTTLPITMNGKSPYYSTAQSQYAYRTTSVSPPERAESSTTSGMHSAVPSYSNSATSSSYAGSASDYESSGSSAGGVDLHDYIADRFTGAFDPLPLDHSLATQAQTSGKLNAKHRELMDLQALAQRRLASTRANFADGMRAAKDVKRDLDWTQKRVTALKSKAERKHPTEYRNAKNRYPSPEY